MCFCDTLLLVNPLWLLIYVVDYVEGVCVVEAISLSDLEMELSSCFPVRSFIGESKILVISNAMVMY